MLKLKNDVQDLFYDRKDLPVAITPLGYFRFTEPVQVYVSRTEYGLVLGQLGDCYDLVRIYIPEGFVLDMASIPPLFRGFVPEVGKHSYGAAVHDFLYRCAGVISWDSGKPVTRKQADQIFDLLNDHYNVRSTRIAFMSVGLKLGGSLSYNKHETNNKNILKLSGLPVVSRGFDHLDDTRAQVEGLSVKSLKYKTQGLLVLEYKATQDEFPYLVPIGSVKVDI